MLVDRYFRNVCSENNDFILNAIYFIIVLARPFSPRLPCDINFHFFHPTAVMNMFSWPRNGFQPSAGMCHKRAQSYSPMYIPHAGFETWAATVVVERK